MIGNAGSGRHGAINGRKLLHWQYVNWRIALYKDRATSVAVILLVSTKDCYLTAARARDTGKTNWPAQFAEATYSQSEREPD